MYDQNGNKTYQVDVTRNKTSYTYNDLDLVEKVLYNDEEVAEYEYFDNGLKKSKTQGQMSHEYWYDNDQNLKQLKVQNGSEILANNYYQYDGNGNRTRKDTLTGTTTYAYTPTHQLEKVMYPSYTEELFYDKRSNRTQRIKNGIEELYQYDPRNRLTNLTTRNSINDEETRTNFIYDNAGNLIKDNKAIYEYNEFNQTTKVETFDANIQINRYDAEGLRHEMEENGQLVQFIFNTNREVIAEKENTWTSYIRTSELIASSNEYDKTFYHYASDEMGSITHIAQGIDILNQYEYDAWGEVVNQTETVSNRFKFNGQQLDPITQQYYLRARYYNPVIARFTQEDTYRGDGLNLYAYCRNNPVSYVDPSGHKSECYKQAYKEARRNNKSRREAREIAQVVLDKNSETAQAIRDATPFDPNSDVTTLYRFMTQAEYNSLMENGKFTINPDGSGYQGKQFGFNVKEIINLGIATTNSTDSKVIKTTVPTSILKEIGDFTRVDQDTLYSGSVTIPIEYLKILHKSKITLDTIDIRLGMK